MSFEWILTSDSRQRQTDVVNGHRGATAYGTQYLVDSQSPAPRRCEFRANGYMLKSDFDALDAKLDVPRDQSGAQTTITDSKGDSYAGTVCGIKGTHVAGTHCYQGTTLTLDNVTG